MAKREDLACRIGLVVLMAAGTAACVSRAGLETAAIAPDPNTEIGRAMIEATRNPGPYLQFSDIPKVPAVAQVKVAPPDGQARLASERDAFATQLAALPKSSQPLTELEAARLRALIAVQPAPENNAVQTEAFARQLRQRAKPPPAPR